MGPLTFLAALALPPASAETPVVLAEGKSKPPEPEVPQVEVTEVAEGANDAPVVILNQAPDRPEVEAPVEVADPVAPTTEIPVVLAEAGPPAPPPPPPPPAPPTVVAAPVVLAVAGPPAPPPPPAPVVPEPPVVAPLARADDNDYDCVFIDCGPRYRLDHPLERSLDADFLAHLPPENFAAPLWRLLGPAEAVPGLVAPTLQWKGLPVAGPGDALPELPVGSVQNIKAIAAPSGGDLWAPGGRAVEMDLGLSAGGALQVSGATTPRPTLRGIGRTMGRQDNVLLGAAVDAEPYRMTSLATATVEQHNSQIELLASGSMTPNGTDILVGTSVSEDELGTSLSAVGRVWTDPDGRRVYRVGAGATLERDEATGLSAGLEVDHWAADVKLVRRAGAFVEESQSTRFLDLVAAVRIDAQDRASGVQEDRIDLGPRAHARLHTAAAHQTGLTVGYARSGGSYTPLDEDIPATDQVVLGVDQALPGDLIVSATGTATRIEGAETVSFDVGIDRRGEDLSFIAHVTAGGWTQPPPGATQQPWASAVAMASWDVELLVPTRLGIAGRWRSLGEEPSPIGAVGWLDGMTAPHADLGGRAVASLPLGDISDQALEFEVSGWARSHQLPVVPRYADLGDRLYPASFRGEAAVRYAW